MHELSQRLIARQYNLGLEGFWTSEGPQVLDAGNYVGGKAFLSGGFALGSTISLKILDELGLSAPVKYQLTYSVNFLKVDNDTSVLQLTWSKSMPDNGTSNAGVVALGVLHRGRPGIFPMSDVKGSPLSPIETAPPPILPMVKFQALPKISVYIDIPMEWGYQGSDGVYYSVATRLRGNSMILASSAYNMMRSEWGDGGSSSSSDDGSFTDENSDGGGDGTNSTAEEWVDDETRRIKDSQEAGIYEEIR